MNISIIKYNYLLFLLFLSFSAPSQNKPEQVNHKDLYKKAAQFNINAIRLSTAGQFDSSFIYHNKAAALYLALHDTLSFAACQINIAKAYRDLAHYEKSLEQLIKAAAHLESCCRSDNKRILYLTSCYTTMASLYREIGSYEKAEEHYHQILQHVKALNGEQVKIIEARTLNNLGNLYLSQKDHQSSKSYFLKSMQLKKSLKKQNGLASTLNNLGIVDTHLGNYAEAESNLLQALTIKEKTGNKKHIATTLNQLGHLYALKQQYKRAETYLTRGKQIIQEIGTLDLMVENQEFTIKLFQASNQLNDLVSVYSSYVLLKDSLLDKEKAESLAEMQIRYETEKKQQAIDILEKEKKLHEASIELRQWWIISLTVGLILILTIAGLLYYNFRRERKGRTSIQILMQELQHRIKNNLQTLSSLLSLQTRSLSDEVAIAAIKSGESRINAMAVIHQKLNASQKYTVINISDYTNDIIDYLTQTYGYEQLAGRIHADITSTNIDVDIVIPLGLITNELVSNVFKYAFPDHKDPKLDIAMKLNYDGKLVLTVKDNGPGMPTDPKKRKVGTLGLQIVDTLTKQLKGTINRKVNNGLQVTVEIPLK